MGSNISDHIQTELTRRYSECNDVGVIAQELVAIWHELDAVLNPIIGQRGVSALYQRSLYLASATFPWLTSSPEDLHTTIDLAHLKTLLLQQRSDDVIAGAGLLLKIFHELLVNLVGPSLTERLLRSVGAHLFSGPPAQESL